MITRILVATHGNAAADSALRVARDLAARHRATVEVVTVLEPLPLYDSGFAPSLLPYAQVDLERKEELLARVRTQVDIATGQAGLWNIALRIGSPAHEIARAAVERDASIIVLGTGPHATADVMFGTETALKASRLSPVPVLAVRPGIDALPARVLAATDFSPSSRRAAQLALDVLDPAGTLYLTHISPQLDLPSDAVAEWERSYGRVIATLLERTAYELQAPHGVTIEPVTRRGNAAKELLALAHEHDVQLVCAGSHGYNFVERLLVGSVATKLLRAAPCSVLLAPAAAAVKAPQRARAIEPSAALATA